jgi:hypothetical protein
MQGKHLFEYAIIRVVPKVEREEFINVGVILYCTSKKFLQTEFNINKNKLDALCEDLDLDEIEQRLNAFKLVCKGGKDGGTIGQLTIASRFRWLTATRSTIVQTSKVHPGFCEDPATTLKKLYEKLVL